METGGRSRGAQAEASTPWSLAPDLADADLREKVPNRQKSVSTSPDAKELRHKRGTGDGRSILETMDGGGGVRSPHNPSRPIQSHKAQKLTVNSTLSVSARFVQWQAMLLLLMGSLRGSAKCREPQRSCLR